MVTLRQHDAHADFRRFYESFRPLGQDRYLCPSGHRFTHCPFNPSSSSPSRSSPPASSPTVFYALMKSEYSRSFIAKGETGSLLPLLAHESISSESERSCDRQSRSWRKCLLCGLGASTILLLGLLYVSTLGIILPSSETSQPTGVLVRPKCTVPRVRKEW